MQMAAIVPTTTIMKAAADSSAMIPAPLSTAPTSTANRASTSPVRLSRSTALHPARPQPRTCPARARSRARLRRGFAPVGQPRTQARQRLAVQLADTRLGHFQHRADLLQVQTVAVVERHHQPFALRQVRNGPRELGAELVIRRVLE